MQKAQTNKNDEKTDDKPEKTEDKPVNPLLNYDYDDDDEKNDENSAEKLSYDNQFDKDPEYRKMARKLQGNIEQFMGVDKKLIDSLNSKNQLTCGRSCIIDNAR